MTDTKPKPLSSLIFFPLLSLIFLRPFFSGLAYPALELYYQNLIIFLAITTLAVEAKARFRVFPRRFDNFPVIFLLFAYSIATIFSVNIQNSLTETIKFISFFSVFFIASQIDEKQKKILIKVIVLTACIISLYSIYQYFWGYQHTLDYLKTTNNNFLLTSSYARDILIAKRAIGTFPSPNILGSYLILAFFLSLQILFERGKIFLPRAKSRGFSTGPVPNACRVYSKRIWYGAGSKNILEILFEQSRELLIPLLILFALLLTKSMGAWLSLILALIALFVLSHKSIKKQRLMLWLSFIFIALAITFILVTRWERLMDMANPQNSITQRLNYWRTAIAMIKDNPLFGVGPGNFQEVFLKYKMGLSTDTRYAHNIFLHHWAETGILGLLGIIYLIISFFRRFRITTETKFIFLSGLAFILHNLVDNTYFIPEVGLFWWVLLTLVF